METFVEQIQQSRVQDKETEVKVKGTHAIFPAGKIIQINCKANVWPDIKNHFQAPVINYTSHDITIRNTLITGHTEYVTSIVSLEMTTRTAKT